MLTRKQHELLTFNSSAHEGKRYPRPSFDEMKDALDLASKSGIHRLITALEERGFIRRLANRRARAGGHPACLISMAPGSQPVAQIYPWRDRGWTVRRKAGQPPAAGKRPCGRHFRAGADRGRNCPAGVPIDVHPAPDPFGHRAPGHDFRRRALCAWRSRATR